MLRDWCRDNLLVNAEVDTEGLLHGEQLGSWKEPLVVANQRMSVKFAEELLGFVVTAMSVEVRLRSGQCEASPEAEVVVDDWRDAVCGNAVMMLRCTGRKVEEEDVDVDLPHTNNEAVTFRVGEFAKNVLWCEMVQDLGLKVVGVHDDRRPTFIEEMQLGLGSVHELKLFTASVVEDEPHVHVQFVGAGLLSRVPTNERNDLGHGTHVVEPIGLDELCGNWRRDLRDGYTLLHHKPIDPFLL